MKKLSVCIPVYNNENNLLNTINVLLEHLKVFDNKYDIEIVMVDDGSQDESYSLMKRIQNQYPDIIKIGKLTRNFGQGACTNACLQMATGDVIGTIAADLQTPASVLVEMIMEIDKGYKLVIAARNKRTDGVVSVLFSRLTHFLIHRFIDNKYPKGGFDFCVMERCVLDDYLKIDLVDSFGQLKMLFLGYKCSTIYYAREERTVGKSGWTLGKKFKVFEMLCTNYTAAPIWCGIIVGAIVVMLSLFALFLTAIMGEFNKYVLLCLLILIVLGFVIILLGVLGLYIWNIILYVRKFPQYIMDSDRCGEED